MLRSLVSVSSLILFACSGSDSVSDPVKTCTATVYWTLPTEREDGSTLDPLEIEEATLVINGEVIKVDPFMLSYSVSGSTFYQIGMSVTAGLESDYAFIEKNCN